MASRFILSVTILLLIDVAYSNDCSKQKSTCINEINPCENNNEYEKNNEIGSCYKFHLLGATWVEAKVICNMEGAELAIVNSQAEAEYLKELFAAHHAQIEEVESAEVARLGLRLISKIWRYPDGTYFGASGYSKWGTGEPSNPKSSQCGGILRNGLIDDIQCNNKVAFICESKM